MAMLIQEGDRVGFNNYSTCLDMMVPNLNAAATI